MTSRLATLAAHDARLQFRNGIYYAYAFVIAFYAGVLVYGAPYLPEWFVGTLVYTDPAVVGFFFLGALFMLEKSENTRSALAMTPVSASEYVLSKTLTLATLSLLSVVVIGSFVHTGVNWWVLLPSTILTSVFYISIGFPIAMQFKTVTGYLIGSAGLLTPIILPAAIAYFDPMPAWAILWPPAAQFNLIQIGLGKPMPPMWEILASFVVMAVAAVLANRFGVKSLSTELGRK